MVRSFINIIALLILSTLLVVLLGVGAINVKQEIENPVMLGCGVIDEYNSYSVIDTINHPGANCL